MHMEISRGDIKFLYALTLVPPKYIGFQKPKVSKCRNLSMQTLFSFLMLGDASKLGVADWFELTNKTYAIYKHLRIHINHLEMYGK